VRGYFQGPRMQNRSCDKYSGGNPGNCFTYELKGEVGGVLDPILLRKTTQRIMASVFIHNGGGMSRPEGSRGHFLLRFLKKGKTERVILAIWRGQKKFGPAQQGGGGEMGLWSYNIPNILMRAARGGGLKTRKRQEMK